MNLILEKLLTRKKLHFCSSAWFLTALGFIAFSLLAGDIALLYIICELSTENLIYVSAISLVIHGMLDLTLYLLAFYQPYKKEKALLFIFLCNSFNFLLSTILMLGNYCDAASIVFIGSGNLLIVLPMQVISCCCDSEEKSAEDEVHLDSVSLGSCETSSIERAKYSIEETSHQ